MVNSRVNARADAREVFAGRVFLATVADTNGDLIVIIRDGEAEPDPQAYPAGRGLADVVSPGDRVLCVVGGGVPHVVQVFDFEAGS